MKIVLENWSGMDDCEESNERRTVYWQRVCSKSMIFYFSQKKEIELINCLLSCQHSDEEKTCNRKHKTKNKRKNFLEQRNFRLREWLTKILSVNQYDTKQWQCNTRRKVAQDREEDTYNSIVWLKPGMFRMMVTSCYCSNT